MKKRFYVTAVIIYSLVVLYFGVGLFLFPQKTYSENENRMLTTLKRASMDAIFDKSFFKSLDKFSTDQFPHRDLFLKANAVYDISLGRLESGGVMLGDNALIKRLEYTDTAEAQKSMNGIKRLIEEARKSEKNAYFLCPPAASEVLYSYCPSIYDDEEIKKAEEFIKNEYGDTILITDLLQSKANSGEYVYYKTDHHWTSLGAYYAYRELGEILGYEPYKKEDFIIETLNDDFVGTSYTSSLIQADLKDEINVYRFPLDENITVTDKITGESLKLYDKEKLDTVSKYDVFLGGNRAHIEINGNTENPNLVIVKDSFANSLVPFLARHFNVTLIDPRYVRGDVYELVLECIKEKNASLLILINIDTVFTGTGL